jgi:hypothetical protein
LIKRRHRSDHCWRGVQVQQDHPALYLQPLQFQVKY